MRVLGGQVHVAEILALAVLSFLCFLIGTSLPLVAGIALLVWPLLVLQLAFDGVGFWIGSMIFARRNRGKPTPPKRTGLARFLWLVPLIALTIGYGLYVVRTGQWFLRF